ncbi:RHS repeat-associated core domain protein [Streptococcus sp. oral taxon 056 str. F0418]|uniref:RHS repeat-associated core domain-containing protein n=1 Tax=Streptococcus sp. oral taxon 056 TaxID=712620 RepID=UPI00021813F3|nr:RHS repeat-associated core domain-containing protein [Streptococcus sp. oral taxon 056]EGP67281.1 RHS repeat-associated core domain protein [Streptococcus sp. oral taxon 056 str. F0418]
MTNQSGSVTGLTKDGQAVASSRYHLYGARKTSTDRTGQPFAYNGEARDDTELDYLRARYYDNQGGTFLTEDSYPGEATDPLSQNRYSYVQNNPVNYTDPSGHFWNSLKKGWNYVKKTASNAWNSVKRVASNTWNTVKRVASNTWNSVKSFASKAWNATTSAFNHAANWVGTQFNRAVNWGSRQWSKVQTAYHSASDYVQTQYQRVAAQIEAKRQQVVRSAYALATGSSSSPTIREGMNLLRNWGTALQNTLKHICNPKTTSASDKEETKVPSIADFRKYEDAAKHGLTVSEKASIDSSSLSDLKNKYGNVLGNYSTYQGTGYFNPLGSAKNRYIISRYKELKAIEDAKVAQKVAEMNKYHYTNLYKHIAETENRIDGTPASDLEKAIAPYVPWIAPIQDVAVAVAGRQITKYNSSVPTGNGMKWGAVKATKAVDKASGASKTAKAVDKTLDVARVTDKIYDVKDANKVMKSIDELSPKELQNMTLDEIKSTIPDNSGWAVYEHNGFVHIKKNGVDRIKLDPPDKVTTYPHMHIYDENKNLLNIDGEIVGRKNPAGHIPWNNGGS